MVKDHSDSERERNVLFNDTLNTFYLQLYGIRYMVKDHSDSEREREMFYLTTHSTHFIYGYMASDIWLRTILILRKETRCRHIGYSYQLTARVLLYAPSHRHTTAFVTPIVEHWLEREIAQWVHPMKDRSDDPSHHELSNQLSINCPTNCKSGEYFPIYNTFKKQKAVFKLPSLLNEIKTT